MYDYVRCIIIVTILLFLFLLLIIITGGTQACVLSNFIGVMSL